MPHSCTLQGHQQAAGSKGIPLSLPERASPRQLELQWEEMVPWCSRRTGLALTHGLSRLNWLYVMRMQIIHHKCSHYKCVVVWKWICCEISFRWGNPAAVFPSSVSYRPYRHSFPIACSESCRSREGAPEGLIHKVSLTFGSLASVSSCWAYSEPPTVFYDHNSQGVFFSSLVTVYKWFSPPGSLETVWFSL